MSRTKMAQLFAADHRFNDQNILPLDYLYDLDHAADYFGFRLGRYSRDMGFVAVELMREAGESCSADECADFCSLLGLLTVLSLESR